MRKIITTLAMAALAALASVVQASPYSTAVLNDNPILYFRLGEGAGTPAAADSSTSADNGAFSNSGVTLGVPGLISGDANTAVRFSGGNVSIPNITGINFVNSPFSIEAWIQPSVFGFFLRVFDKVGASTPNGYGLDMTSSQLRLTGSVNLNLLPFTFQANNVYYVVGTSDGSGTGSLYVNGSLQVSGAYFSSNPFTSAARIGDSSNSPGCCAFNGVIDEVAVYGQALSSGQIAAHYAAGTLANPGVPEPSSWVLLGTGLAVFLGALWNRARKLHRSY